MDSMLLSPAGCGSVSHLPRSLSQEEAKAGLGAALLSAVLSPGTATVENAVLPGLGQWLEGLKLAHCEEPAEEWCRRNAISSLAQVRASWERFAEDLGLRPLERKRLAKEAETAHEPQTVLPAVPAAPAAPAVHPAPAAETFGPPEDPERYRVLEAIGAGATARVFRCREAHTGRELAVKRIGLEKLRRQGNFAQIEEMLHQEMAIHLSLQHPKVVCLVDVIEAPQELRLVMECLGGGALDDLLAERGAMSETQASGVFRQIAEGLRYIHSRGIAHRDLKPANVLLVDRAWQHSDAVPEVKLADFGHSKVADDHFGWAPKQVGTPLYMAPEVLEQGPEGLVDGGRRADLWSLGVLLHALVLGCCPFQGVGAELQAEILRGELTFWSEDPAVPPPSKQAQSLVRALLQLDPRRRRSLDWCLAHAFVVGAASLGRHLLQEGLRAGDQSPDEHVHKALEERYLLAAWLPEAAALLLRQDLRRWMLKFRYSVIIKGLEVVANYGDTATADWAQIEAAQSELLQVMSYHTRARRPFVDEVTKALADARRRGDVKETSDAQGTPQVDQSNARSNGHCVDSSACADGGQSPQQEQTAAEPEDEAAARQRRLAARQKASRSWNFTGRSAAGGPGAVDDRFRAQESELDRRRRLAFGSRGAFRTTAEDMER